MQRKSVFAASGICLLLLLAFISTIGANGEYMPLELQYTTASNLEKGTTALFNYVVKFDDDYKGYIAPKTQLTLDYIKTTREIGDESHGNKYTFDTLETRSWEIDMDAKGIASGTLELAVPNDDKVAVTILAINGSNATVATIGFDRKSNIPGKQEYIKRTPDSSTTESHRKPRIEDFTSEQLQMEYDVVIDLRDTSKMAEATQILGEIPAGKELIKYPGGFRIKTSLSNLIKLAHAGIQFGYITTPPWVRPTELIKDTTEYKTIEGVDSHSVTPPLTPTITISSEPSIAGWSFN